MTKQLFFLVFYFSILGAAGFTSDGTLDCSNKVFKGVLTINNLNYITFQSTGDIITLDLYDTPDCDTILHIFDSSQNEIIQFNDVYDPVIQVGYSQYVLYTSNYGLAELIQLQLPVGTYYIGVQAVSCDLSFEFYLRMNECKSPQGTIQCGNTINTALTTIYDVKSYKFESYGTQITFDTCSTNFDTKILVYDSDGAAILIQEFMHLEDFNGVITSYSDCYINEKMTLVLPSGIFYITVFISCNSFLKIYRYIFNWSNRISRRNR